MLNESIFLFSKLRTRSVQVVDVHSYDETAQSLRDADQQSQQVGNDLVSPFEHTNDSSTSAFAQFDSAQYGSSSENRGLSIASCVQFGVLSSSHEGDLLFIYFLRLRRTKLKALRCLYSCPIMRFVTATMIVLFLLG